MISFIFVILIIVSVYFCIGSTCISSLLMPPLSTVFDSSEHILRIGICLKIADFICFLGHRLREVGSRNQGGVNSSLWNTFMFVCLFQKWPFKLMSASDNNNNHLIYNEEKNIFTYSVHIYLIPGPALNYNQTLNSISFFIKSVAVVSDRNILQLSVA